MSEILNQTKAGYDKAQFKDNVIEERRSSIENLKTFERNFSHKTNFENDRRSISLGR